MIVTATFAVSVLTIIMGGISEFTSALDSISSIALTISNIIGVAVLVMVLILLFRPGLPGDNQYGKNPINTKVGFLG